MIWNHRVVRHFNPSATFEDEREYYTIEECYYYGDDHDNPSTHTIGLSLFGLSVDELRETLNRMIRCLDYPVVDELSSKSDEPNIIADANINALKELSEYEDE